MQKRFGDNLPPVLKYWIFLFGIILAIFAVIFGSFAASYLSLTSAEQQTVGALFEKLLPFPFLGSLLLMVIICSLVSLIFRYYIIPVLRMAEQTRLITAANPDHRISVQGALELRILAEVINESADAYQRLQAEVDSKIEQANLNLHVERNRLAALMSQLPYGVLVCNADGTILLYNREAQQMLEGDGGESSSELRFGGRVGLGRSVFSVLDRAPIVHMLEVMNQAHAHGQLKPAFGLLTKLCGQRFLRVNMAAITDSDQEGEPLTGFVLSLEDITAEIDAGNERDRQLQELIDAVQLSMGRIQGGLSAICDLPGTGGEACDQHRRAIQDVAGELQNHLAMAREFYSQHRQGFGSSENVLAETLLAILARNLRERFGLEVETYSGQGCWLKIDSYSLVQAINHLAGLLKAEFRIERLVLSLRDEASDYSQLVISWSPRQIPCVAVDNWQEAPLFMDGSGKMESPRSVLARNGGGAAAENVEGRCSNMVLTLPRGLTEKGSELLSPIPPRPVSYEFDLFHQTFDQELADLPLNKLTFVAFDT